MASSIQPALILRRTSLLQCLSRTPNTLKSRPTHRALQTASSSRNPTISNAPARPDYLDRIANRPLPTLAQLSTTRRWVRSFPIFVGIMVASALCIFNYEKANSPIIAATLYSLRTNPRVRRELGDEVYFAYKWAWIWGSINLVHGNVDVSFSVKGTKGRGVCRFKAKRFGGKAGMFKTTEWSLTLDNDGRVIQLLEDAGKDPIKGAGV